MPKKTIEEHRWEARAEGYQLGHSIGLLEGREAALQELRDALAPLGFVSRAEVEQLIQRAVREHARSRDHATDEY